MKIQFSNFSLIRSFELIGLIALILMFAFSVLACGQKTKTDSKPVAVKEASNSQSSIKALPKLLDLGAKKCIPCKKMAPILEEMEKEYKGVLDVEFVDVWQAENKERAMNHKIRGIPTQILL